MPTLSERMTRLRKRAGLIAFGAFYLFGAVLLLFGYRRHQLVEPPYLTVGVLVVAGMIVALVRLRRSGNWAGLVVFLGVVLYAELTFGYLPATNAFFDGSPAQQHRVKIRRFNGGKAATYAVDSWRPGEDERIVFVVAELCKAEGTHLLVTTHAGALGFEWVSDVKCAD